MCSIDLLNPSTGVPLYTHITINEDKLDELRVDLDHVFNYNPNSIGFRKYINEFVKTHISEDLYLDWVDIICCIPKHTKHDMEYGVRHFNTHLQVYSYYDDVITYNIIKIYTDEKDRRTEIKIIDTTEDMTDEDMTDEDMTDEGEKNSSVLDDDNDMEDTV
jgi:hypothetical protein